MKYIHAQTETQKHQITHRWCEQAGGNGVVTVFNVKFFVFRI